jgi:hypothetical protein
MSCCGKGRQELTRSTASAPARPITMPHLTVMFEHTGAGVLTVDGPVTGVRYTFNGPGARVSVDARDRNHLMHVPRLRIVSTS